MVKQKGYSLKKKKNGTVLVSVYVGKDVNGKQMFERKTWHPDKNLTEKQNARNLEKFAMEFHTKVKQGKILKGEKITFEEFVKTWLEVYAKERLAPSTIECYQTILKNNLLPYFGQTKLVDITPYMISRFYTKLKKDGHYKQNTIKKINAVFSSILKTALIWGMISMNPCTVVEIPDGDSCVSREKCFGIKDMLKFISILNSELPTKNGKTTVLSAQLQTLFLLAVYSGMRRGELLALTWNDINWDEGAINISKSVYRKDGKTLIKIPKTKSSIRIITIPQLPLEKLHQLMVERKKAYLQLGIRWDDNSPIFIQETGSIMHLSTPTHSFSNFLKRYNASVEENEKLPEISFHGLRHTYASVAIALGNHLSSISGHLGHVDTAITLKIYTHWLKEQDACLTDSFEKLMEKIDKVS